ncbi:hypothetical protein IA539_15485 [Gordonia sp. zg691]|uniref:hypothetical protein n=1 Tax=Gordonia jinghuaiqii TaxID=2758710 RepID=UPI0016623841|nr:hypothetical protein [Gordonia jinghuaiqii]MBD0862604.1 hypothetical protein [Gordonia jinghuaiqii]
MNAWIATKDPAKVATFAAQIAAHEPNRLDEADGDREFAVWLYAVDRIIRTRTEGFDHRDFPDWGWRDLYDNDWSPTDAAADAQAHWEEFGDL